MDMERLISSVRSPESATLLSRAVGILAGGVLVWFAFAGTASFLPVWVLIGATVALAVAVFVKSQKLQQRQWWVDQGCCAACGYDLRGLPTAVCPECGRDAAVDEPTWRRLRREHEAKYGAAAVRPAAQTGASLSEAEVRRLLAEAATRATDATG